MATTATTELAELGISIGATCVSFALDWLPPASVRGNKRGHWARANKARENLREAGKTRAIIIERNFGAGAALRGNLGLTIRARTRRIDGDNLLIGFKPFVDGLADGWFFADDSQITDWRIIIERGGGADGAVVELREI